ncbi:MAG: hypothetical protein KAJ18_10165 [Candidatus Omnitrophica bacterium]|nr:hypothetical protein [Candidatus Omnitrophota bacterium]
MFGKKYQITSGEFGSHMCLFGELSEPLNKVIKKKGILELELNYAKGWPQGSDLSLLKDIKQLRSFELIDYQASDISVINELIELRSLKINSSRNDVIDCSNFSNLEEISLEWFPNAKSLFDCVSLKSIFVNSCKIENLTVFNKLHNLEVLRLKSPNIERIGDISSLKNLKFIELSNAKKLTSLEGLEAVPSLEALELNRCRKIDEIDSIASLSLLRRLFLIDSGEIESLRSVGNLKDLEQFLFYESTKIVDGDMSFLKSLAKLKEVSFVDRRHYNLTMEDFNPGHNERVKKALKEFEFN